MFLLDIHEAKSQRTIKGLEGGGIKIDKMADFGKEAYFAMNWTV